MNLIAEVQQPTDDGTAHGVPEGQEQYGWQGILAIVVIVGGLLSLMIYQMRKKK